MTWMGDTAIRPRELDAVIVGAGFAGLYALHYLRDQVGLSVRAYERGAGVGGTWYWNCYPGAGCDGESMDYSYSFSRELQQEWTWTRRFAPQPEILAYLNHVADRFEMRPDIQLETAVLGATYDEPRNCWEVRLDNGETVSSTFLVMASGALSEPKLPEFAGLESFAGVCYRTSRWPHGSIELADKRIGVIGTGSTGIQLIPRLAEVAAQVIVFQRTPNFSVPARNRPLTAEHVAAVKANYDAHRESARRSSSGVTQIRDYDEPGWGVAPRPQSISALDVSPEERQRELDWRWRYGGLGEVLGAYGDIMTDDAANDLVAEFTRSKIRETVNDPATAARLCPSGYPFASKRLCVDNDYYETYNRPNVSLIDVRETEIVEITPAGIRTTAAVHELDVIVFALGFDALTGALLKMDIRGRDGLALRTAWSAGPRSYLGLAIHGFPNLFTITGPGSPSVLSNVVNSIEQHVEWIGECIRYMRATGVKRIEASLADQDRWVEHVREVGDATLFPRADSWYVGANVEGKSRVFLPYVGGVGAYRQICDDVAAEDYRGFHLVTRARAHDLV